MNAKIDTFLDTNISLASIQAQLDAPTEIDPNSDLRRYVGTDAVVGGRFKVDLTWPLTDVARGTWSTLEPLQVAASLQGKVPSIIPEYGGKPYEVAASVQVLDAQRARVTLSGSFDGQPFGPVSSVGNYVPGYDFAISGLDLLGGYLTHIEFRRHYDRATTVKLRAFELSINAWIHALG